MTPRLRPWLLGAALALLAAPTPARADPDPDRLARASDFFDAGAQAYKAGLYVLAAEAFLEAHRLSPSPALLFSAAQAYRSQFVVEPSLATLTRAVALYRDYLRSDEHPRRRDDAMKALEALVPLEARFPAPPPDAPAPVGERPRATRLLLSTPAERAEVSVDGGPFLAAPSMVAVEPGPHRVQVRASGYEDEQLTVDAVAAELVPRTVALRPKPARLRVVGTAGARVAIDGAVRATVPTRGPLAVAPGEHFVAVTLPGHEPYGKVLDLGRDTGTEIEARLPPTRQRILAVTTLSVASAGAVVTGVLTGLAFARQSRALDLAAQQKTTPLSPTDRDRYNGDVEARDHLAKAAAVTGGAAALVAAAGLGLFVLDRPEATPPSDDRRREPSPTPRADVEVGLLSLHARLRF